MKGRFLLAWLIMGGPFLFRLNNASAILKSPYPDLVAQWQGLSPGGGIGKNPSHFRANSGNPSLRASGGAAAPTGAGVSAPAV